MASGHGYRVNRPNTWLLRPVLQSEDSSCQPGAVHTREIMPSSMLESRAAPASLLATRRPKRQRPQPARRCKSDRLIFSGVFGLSLRPLWLTEMILLTRSA